MEIIKNKNKNKILIVDDDMMMRLYLRDIFWVHGRDDTYEIFMADSLVEAEKFLNNPETKPDIIFLDVMIPLVNGDNSPKEKVNRCLSFITRIKKDDNLSKTKIVIYSGQRDKILKEKVRNLGVDDFIIKGDLMPRELISFTDNLHG